MLKNLIVTGLRHLLRHRLFSLINITGLAMGIGSVLLVALFVRHELSWDRDLPNGDRIYMVQYYSQDTEGEWGYNPEITCEVVDQMVPTVPVIEASTKIAEETTSIFFDDEVLKQSYAYVDPDFFVITQPQVIDGSLNKPFENPQSVVLTESTAKRIFGETNVAGKTLELTLFSERKPFSVQAVIADWAPNSRFDAPMFLRMSLLIDRYHTFRPDLWGVIFSQSYVMLRPGATAEEAEAQLAKFPMPPKEERKWSQNAENYKLQPLFKAHLNLDNRRGLATDVAPAGILILMAIGVAILILACVNFTLLAVGLAGTRFREMGIRKVMGARRGALRVQFFTETAIIAFLSMLAGVLLAEIAVPLLDPWTVGGLSLKPVVFCAVVVLLTWIAATFLAAVYPAWIMASSPLVDSLKGSRRVGGRGLVRKGLIFVQLTVAVAMVSAALIMSRQMSFVMKTDLGFHGDQLVVLDASAERGLAQKAMVRLQVALNGDPRFLGFSYSACNFGGGNWTLVGFNKEGLPLDQYFENVVGPGFVNLIGAKLAAGRDFRDDEADRKGAAIVNESFGKAMGWDDPVGKTAPDLLGDARVIGVVKDFHYHSLYEPIKPLVMMMETSTFPKRDWMWIEQNTNRPTLLFVRLSGNDIPGAMKKLESVWKKDVPESAFQASFVDDTVGRQYQSSMQWNHMVSSASGLAVLIALLGLVGVTVMRVVDRTKEIGIRKVLGASVKQILGLMSREIILLVIVGGTIGGLGAAWAMSRWLEGFSYRIVLEPWSFFAAGGVVLALALVTVLALSLRTAQMNPSTTLRDE